MDGHFLSDPLDEQLNDEMALPTNAPSMDPNLVIYTLQTFLERLMTTDFSGAWNKMSGDLF